MDLIKSVIVKNDIVVFSGILVYQKYILITSHLINTLSTNNNLSNNGTKAISKDNRIWIIDKCLDKDYIYFQTREAFLIGNLRNNHVTNIVQHCFSDIYDFSESVSDIEDLFTIHVLSFDVHATVNDLRLLWRNARNQMLSNCKPHLRIADEIYVRAAPFGSRQLIDSYSQGIVCNYVGGVLITDCPTVFGCEGGAVIAKNQNVPLGVVVSSMAGWRGECTGLTLAITFNALFCDCGSSIKCNNFNLSSRPCSKSTSYKTANSLLYVNSGGSWGTGICIDKQQRLIITNAHVITSASITVRSGEACTRARVVFASPAGQPFDLAVLRCDDLTAFDGLQNVVFSKRHVQVGDAVYTCGFPLFAHAKQMQPSMTQGHVSIVKNDVIMTTCAVLPGASGGALCDRNGDLVGVITCNIRNSEGDINYPRVNMNIPSCRIEPILRRYMKQNDVNIFHELVLNEERKADWIMSKL